MADHFTLDIHPHKLRATAHSLDTLRENLAKHAKTSTNEPGQIGQKWTGSAADSVTGEMTALGGHLSTFTTQLLHCSTALTTLASHYEKAKATLADLNIKWAKSESTYSAACADADTAYNTSVGDLRDANGGKVPNRGLTLDLETTRNTAKSNAYTARQSTQNTLETDFTTLRQHLATQTTTCGTTLSTNIPVKNLGMCTASNPTGLDHSNLLTDLSMVADYEDLEKDAEADQAAVDAAAPEIKTLQDALKGDDPQAIEDALKAIQGRVDGPYGVDYSKAMLDALGKDAGAVANAVNSIYNNLDAQTRRGNVDPYDQKDEILAFTNGLARGLTQYSDADYGKFYGVMSDADQGAAQLALIASSGYADSRQTSGALALQSRWYHYPSGSRDLFPEMLQYAYGKPQDIATTLAARSSVESLATVLENVDANKLDRIVESLTLTSRGDRNMTDDEANIQYSLLNGTLEVLKNRFVADSDAERAPSVALVHALQVLQRGHWGSDDISQRQDLDHKLMSELKAITSNGDFVRSYLDQAFNDPSKYPKTLLADLLHSTHTNAKSLVDNLIAAEVKRDIDPAQIATAIGALLRDQDLADMGVDWKRSGIKGIQDALNDALSTIAEKNPVTGAVYGPLKAMIDDLGEQQGKIDEAYKNTDSAALNDTLHHELALAIYIKAHPGEAASISKDFKDFVDGHGLAGDVSSTNRYYMHLMQAGGEMAQELSAYTTNINTGQDDVH